MASKTVNRGVSKSEWLDAALDVLSLGNVHAITVEGLATRLGIAKSGFYWHFKSRDALLKELLLYWIQAVSDIFSASEESTGPDPRLRILEVTEKLEGNRLARYEIAFQQWAQQDREVARAVRRLNRFRLDCFRQALEELGISGDEADMRAYLYVCSVTGEPQLCHEDSRISRQDLIASRIEFLTRP